MKKQLLRKEEKIFKQIETKEGFMEKNEICFI